jgi:hypothetical protein
MLRCMGGTVSLPTLKTAVTSSFAISTNVHRTTGRVKSGPGPRENGLGVNRTAPLLLKMAAVTPKWGQNGSSGNGTVIVFDG